jgi:zinc/manganese transport system permease protein
MPELGEARGIRSHRMEMCFLVVVALATSMSLPAIAAAYTSNWPVGFFVGALGAVSYGAGRGWAAWHRTRAVRRGARPLAA